jgi:hypothetical protein
LGLLVLLACWICLTCWVCWLVGRVGFVCSNSRNAISFGGTNCADEKTAF